MKATTKQARVLADFNRGKLTAKQARKMLTRLSVTRTHKRKETK